jgi:UDP-N-acetylmuramyl pentapeptide phosphotransferase/UDP-N-acetylglucosamine-1-phosphate transferase
MINFLFAALTSFIVSLILLPLIIGVSQKTKFFDEPGGRRIHKKVTPSFGGIAIFSGFVIASLSWEDQAKRAELLVLLLVIAIPFIIGFLDDLLHLKPLMKIAGQSIAATIIFFTLDVRLASLYGLITDYTFSLPVSFAITLIAIIVITNSFNLIDGIDGLAATFSLVAILFFGVWFSLAGAYHYALIAFSISGAILAFLLQNWEPSKIFMGDTGSLFIGMALSILTIEFLNENHQLPSGSVIKFQSGVGTAACIIILPLVDTVRVIILRLYKKVSPFTADKRHIHHVLVRLGMSHRMAVSILCILHLLFISGAIALRPYSDKVVLSLVIGCSVIFCLLLDRILYQHTFNKSR